MTSLRFFQHRVTSVHISPSHPLSASRPALRQRCNTVGSVAPFRMMCVFVRRLWEKPECYTYHPGSGLRSGRRRSSFLIMLLCAACYYPKHYSTEFKLLGGRENRPRDISSAPINQLFYVLHDVLGWFSPLFFVMSQLSVLSLINSTLVPDKIHVMLCYIYIMQFGVLG